MATAKKTQTKKSAPKTTDLDNALYDLKKEGLTENKDFHVHEYVHGYIDIRFDGFHSTRPVLEFRPNGSIIARDPKGYEVIADG